MDVYSESSRAVKPIINLSIMLLTRIKRFSVILVIIAITFIAAGLVGSNMTIANAEIEDAGSPVACQTKASTSSSGFCDDAGCVGGDIDCYAPPQGGMCFTSQEIKLK